MSEFLYPSTVQKQHHLNPTYAHKKSASQRKCLVSQWWVLGMTLPIIGVLKYRYQTKFGTGAQNCRVAETTFSLGTPNRRQCWIWGGCQSGAIHFAAVGEAHVLLFTNLAAAKDKTSEEEPWVVGSTMAGETLLELWAEESTQPILDSSILFSLFHQSFSYNDLLFRVSTVGAVRCVLNLQSCSKES